LSVSKNEILAMGDEWEDRDNYLVSVLHDAAHELSKTIKAIEADNEY
jgi:hypothetical protein